MEKGAHKKEGGGSFILKVSRGELRLTKALGKKGGDKRCFIFPPGKTNPEGIGGARAERKEMGRKRQIC